MAGALSARAPGGAAWLAESGEAWREEASSRLLTGSDERASPAWSAEPSARAGEAIRPLVELASGSSAGDSVNPEDCAGAPDATSLALASGASTGPSGALATGRVDAREGGTTLAGSDFGAVTLGGVMLGGDTLGGVILGAVMLGGITPTEMATGGSPLAGVALIGARLKGVVGVGAAFTQLEAAPGASAGDDGAGLGALRAQRKIGAAPPMPGDEGMLSPGAELASAGPSLARARCSCEPPVSPGLASSSAGASRDAKPGPAPRAHPRCASATIERKKPR